MKNKNRFGGIALKLFIILAVLMMLIVNIPPNDVGVESGADTTELSEKTVTITYPESHTFVGNDWFVYFETEGSGKLRMILPAEVEFRGLYYIDGEGYKSVPVSINDNLVTADWDYRDGKAVLSPLEAGNHRLSIVFGTTDYTTNTAYSPVPAEGWDAELGLDRGPTGEYKFQEPEIKKVQALGDYDSITIPDLYKLNNPGMPVLPYKTAKILLPYGEALQNIEVIPGEEMILNGTFNIEPGQTPIPMSADVMECSLTSADPEVYNSTSSYPSKFYEQVSIQIFRGYRILILRLYPVQYIPRTGTVSYYPKMDVKVTTAPSSSAVADTYRNQPSDEREVKALVDNPWTAATYRSSAEFDTVTTRAARALEGGPYTYVLITSSALQSAFQPLVDWKNQKGVTATIYTLEDIYASYSSVDTTSADNQGKIRAFIKDAYTTWSTVYVLLGGDVGVVPYRGAYGYVKTAPAEEDYNIPCDLYYCVLDGKWNSDGDTKWGEATDNDSAEVDLLAEAYIGRAPVNTADDIATFVTKVKEYEQVLAWDYIKTALMLAAKLDAETDSASLKDWIAANKIPGDFTVTKQYENDGTASVAAFVNAINNGQHLINHDGHANRDVFQVACTDYVESVTKSDIAGLTNAPRYFMFYSQGCYDGAFDNRDHLGSYGDHCIAEYMVNQSNGAFACLVNSRYGWYLQGSTDGPGDKYDKEFWDTLLVDDITNVGKTLRVADQQLVGEVTATGTMRWEYFEHTLLGDPESQVPPGGLGVISLDKASYGAADTANIALLDIDISDSQNVNVKSTTDATGITVTLTETGADTGVFTGTFTFSESASDDGNDIILVTNGDTVTVSYSDASPVGTRTDTATYDTTPPTISEVATASVGYYSVKINWTTNEDSNSEVNYGPTTALGTVKLNPDYTTSNYVVVTVTTAGTYYFDVKSTDVGGNPTTDNNGSAHYTFTVDQEPITFTGATDGDSFGYSVASAMLNNDNYADLIVGAPYNDSADGSKTDCGAVYIFYGSGSLSGDISASSADVKLYGSAAGEYFGYSVANAGDANYNGYDDVVVGAPDASKIYIYYGSATGVSSTPDVTINGTGTNFGCSVAGAGRLNDDDYDDIIISSSENDRVYIYYGSAAMQADFGTTTQQYTNVTSNVTTYGTVSDFTNAQSADDGDAVANITETGVGGSYSFPSNQAFTSNADGWTSSVGGTDSTRMENGFDSGVGNPVGSIYSRTITYVNAGVTGTCTWESSFDYNGGTPTSATLSFDRKVVGYLAATPNQYTIYLVKPDASVATIYPTTAFSAIDSAWVSVTDYSITASEFSQSGTYTIRIFTELSATKSASANTKIHYDNVYLNLTAAVEYRYDVEFNTSSVPSGSNYYLELNYKVSGENCSLYVYDGSTWNVRTTLTAATLTTYSYQLTTAEYNGGTVRVRYVDVNQTGDTVTANSIDIEYHRVRTATVPPANITLIGRTGSRFGYSVASAGNVNGDTYDDVIIGAPDEDEAYIYYGGAMVNDEIVEDDTQAQFNDPTPTTTNTEVTADGEVRLTTDYDPEQLDESYTTYSNYHSVYCFAKKITPTVSGRISRVSFALYYGSGSPLTVEIHANDNGGAPGGTVLGSSTVTSSTSASLEWVDATFAVEVTQDTTYFVAFCGNYQTDGYAWLYDASASNGGTWGIYGDYDPEATWDQLVDTLKMAYKVWIEPGKGYSTSGTFVSGATTTTSDITTVVSWWTEHVPTNTTLTVNLSRDDGATWSAAVTSGSKYTFTGEESVKNKLRYNVTFTCDGSDTPVFYDIQLVIGGAQVILSGDAGTYFGWSVASLGDVSGTANEDVIVGAPQSGNGKAYVYEGGASMDADADITFTGTYTSEGFGYSVASAGDVDNDNYLDIVIGAPYNHYAGSYAGAAYIFYGAGTWDTTADITVYGEWAGDKKGFAVSSAGDLDYDNNDDVFVGAPYYNNTNNKGRAYVVSYAVANVAASITLQKMPSAGAFIDSKSAATYIINWTDSDPDDNATITLYYDTDNTGYDGTLIGTVSQGEDSADNNYTWDISALAVGRYYVYAKIDDGVNSPVYSYSPGFLLIYNKLNDIVSMSGGLANDLFGLNLSSGRINNDDYDDLIIGAPYNDSGGSDAGAVYIFYGSGSLTGSVAASSADVILTGAASDLLGWSVSSADLDNNGYDDVIAGAPGSGKTYVFLSYNDGSGIANGQSANITLTGNSADKFGTAVTSGDVNNDTYYDIVVGAYLNDTSDGTKTDAGAVYFFRSYSGMSGTISISNANVTLYGGTAGDKFGFAVCSAGDVNSNDCDDVLIGAPGANKAYIYYGTTKTDEYNYVDENVTTNGTITNFANAQSAADGGLYAILTENFTGSAGVDETNWVDENVTTLGTILNFINAQAEDGDYATLTEADTGSAGVEDTNYVDENVTTYGTIDNFGNAQSATDSGAYATLTENDTGSAGVEDTNYVDENVTTYGTIDGFANAQSATDGGLYATLTEENTGGGGKGSTTYDYSSGAGTDKWAYEGIDTNDVPPASQTTGTEFTSYTEIATSNDVRYDTGGGGASNNPYHRFQFTISEAVGDITQLDVSWEGYGPTGGAKLYIWNFATPAWDLVGSHAVTAPPDGTISLTYTTGISNYIDASGYLHLCAIDITNKATNILTDYVYITVTSAVAAPNYKLNITFNTTGVVSATNYYLQLNYNTTGEYFDVLVYNATSSGWNDLGDLTATSMTEVQFTLASDHYDSGTIRVRYLGQNETGDSTDQDKLYIEYHRIRSYTAATTNYQLNITFNTTSVASAVNYYLQLNYSTTGEYFDVLVYNATSSGWNDLGDLTATSMTEVEFTLASDHYDSGTIRVRYLGQNESGDSTSQDKLYIEYHRIRSYTAPSVNYELNITFNTTSVVAADSYYLQLNYSTTGEVFDVFVYNTTTSGWNDVGDLTATSMTEVEFTLASDHYDSGTIRVRYIGQNETGDSTSQDSLYIEYHRIRSYTAGTTNYQLNITFNTTSVVSAENYYLQINYQANGENFDVLVYNASSLAWDDKGDLNSATMIQANFTLASDHYNSGNIRVRYVGKTEAGDSSQSTLYIEYHRIRSYSTGGIGGTANVTMNGDAGTEFGCSIAYTGDVNNDAYNDIVVGAPGYDPGAAADTGRAYIFYGNDSMSSSIAVANANVTLTGTSQGDRFGYSVSGGGDINNDTYNDTIVGAPYCDNSTLADAGAVYIFYGGAMSDKYAYQSNNTTFGQNANDKLGWAVHSGNVNNDDYNDILAGAPYYDAGGSSDEGTSYVLSTVAGGPAVPTGLTISIDAGAGYTSSSDADLTVAASSATDMCFSNDGSTWSDWETYATTKSNWNLTVGCGGSDTDDTKTVYYKCRNAVGESSEKTDTIVLDRAVPTNPTGCTEAGSAAGNTWQNSVSNPSFSWTGADDATSGVDGYYYYWGSDSDGTSSDYTTSASYDPGAPGEGTFYLRVKTRDNAGNNASWTTIFTFKYDGTAPGNPTGCTEAGSAASDTWQNSVSNPSFSWTGASDTGGSDVNGYYYYWGTASDGTTTDYNTTGAFDPGAPGEGTYYLRVKTRDAAANNASWTTIFTFKYDGTAPGNPTGCTEAGSAASDTWQNSVSNPSFSWTGASDTGGSDVNGYYYYWGTASDGTTSDYTASAGYDPDAPGEGTFYLRVKTRDTAANNASWTTIFTFKYDGTAPGNPDSNTSSHTVGIWSTDNTVQVTWAGHSDARSGIAGFRYSWSTSSDTVPTDSDTWTTSTSTTSSELDDSATWYLHVRAKDNATNLGSDAYHIGPFKIDTTVPTSNAPTLTRDYDADGSYTISFSASDGSGSGVTNYWLQEKIGIGGSWTNVNTSALTATSYDVSGKTIGETYYYQVCAKDAVGMWSSWSSVSNGITINTQNDLKNKTGNAENRWGNWSASATTTEVYGDGWIRIWNSNGASSQEINLTWIADKFTNSTVPSWSYIPISGNIKYEYFYTNFSSETPGNWINTQGNDTTTTDIQPNNYTTFTFNAVDEYIWIRYIIINPCKDTNGILADAYYSCNFTVTAESGGGKGKCINAESLQTSKDIKKGQINEKDDAENVQIGKNNINEGRNSVILLICPLIFCLLLPGKRRKLYKGGKLCHFGWVKKI